MYLVCRSIERGRRIRAGYCRFSSYAEDANGHPEWHEETHNPDLITIYYAGMLSTAYYCSLYLTKHEEQESVPYPEGSERDDLERIQKLLAQMDIDLQQRKAITDSCWMQAQKILSEYHLAVTVVAEALVKQRTLSGYEAHRLIWQVIGYPHEDWRFVALGIKEERKAEKNRSAQK